MFLISYFLGFQILKAESGNMNPAADGNGDNAKDKGNENTSSSLDEIRETIKSLIRRNTYQQELILSIISSLKDKDISLNNQMMLLERSLEVLNIEN